MTKCSKYPTKWACCSGDNWSPDLVFDLQSDKNWRN